MDLPSDLAVEMRSLVHMRREVVGRYDFFTPDTVYPIYACRACGERQISTSTLSTDVLDYDSFAAWVSSVRDSVSGLPLARCNCGEGSAAAEPVELLFFSFFGQEGFDLLLDLRADEAMRCFRIGVEGENDLVGAMETDEDFLGVFAFPFSHRWAWKTLVEKWRGHEGLHAQRIAEGYVFVVAASDAGEVDAQGWQAIAREAGSDLDHDLVFSLGPESLELGYEDAHPAIWMPREALALRRGELRCWVLASTAVYRQLLASALAKTGILLVDGEGGELRMSKSPFHVDFDLASLLGRAAYSGLPPERVFRHYLMGRLRHLEALNRVGRRISRAVRPLKCRIEEGSVLAVRDEQSKRIRRFDLGDHTESLELDDEAFRSYLREEFGYDPDRKSFVIHD